MENSISFNGEDTIQSGIFHLGFYKDFKQVWILVKPEKDLFCTSANLKFVKSFFVRFKL